MTKEHQSYNSAGKKQNKELLFVNLDIDVKSVSKTKEYKKLMGKWLGDDKGWENRNVFTGTAIPLKYYEDVCTVISKITRKAYKEGLYYGVKKK